MKLIKYPVIIHIGYPKTATTTLQRHLFPNEKFINLGLEKHKNIVNDIILLNEIPFTGNLTKYRKQIFDDIQDQEKHYRDKEIVILSDESITSNSTFFRYTPYPFIWVPDPASIARKISYLFDSNFCLQPPKILITIRKQTDFLKSNYAQMYNLIFKSNKSTNSFKKFIDYSFNHNFDNFVGAAINYNQIIYYYESLFGKENIQILIYEDLMHNPKNFASILGEIIGLAPDYVLKICNKKENVKRSESNYQQDKRNFSEILNNRPFILNLKTKIHPNISRKIARVLSSVSVGGRKLKLNYEDEEMIMSYYKQDNHLLSDRYNLNLSKYNYYQE